MVKGHKYVLALTLLFHCFLYNGQNLVPNGDFETYTGCPTNLSGFLFGIAPPWSVPAGHFGSSDYYNACYVTGNAALSPSVPVNGFGQQAAHSGDGYAGIYLYCTNPVQNPNWDYREYITVPLSTPLVAGTIYNVGFYTSRAENHMYAADGIGLHLSSGPIASGSNFQPIPVTPQIENPSGNIMTDSVNWILVSAIYTAVGGEDHLTIGNFKSNQNTNLQAMNLNPLLGVENAYYYVDDAFVLLAQLQVTGDSICYGDSITLQASGDTQFAWADSLAPNTILSDSSSLMVSPQFTTTYLVYGTNDTVAYTVHVNYPPDPMSLELGNDTILCQGETLALDVTYSNANYLWQDGSVGPQFQVSQAGQYFVAVSNFCGAFADTLNVSYFNPLPFYLGNDTTVCAGTNVVLNVTIPGTQTQWQDQTISNSYTVSEAGTYIATTTFQECVVSDEITIDYITAPEVDLGEDRFLCEDETYLLVNLASGEGAYLWNTGSQDNFILIDSAGIYVAAVSNQCGASTDTILVEDKQCDCQVYLPNAFSPNGDENNNLFGAKSDCVFSDFNLKIFNRWGEVIWESNDSDVLWDGTYQNNQVKEGTYVYKLKYSNEFVFDELIVGHVVVLR